MNNLTNIGELKEWGEFAIKSGVLPQGTTQYQAMAIIQAGKEIGLQALQSLRSMSFIRGRLTMSVQLQLALAKARGVKLIKVEEEEGICKVELERGEEKIACEYTIQDAKKAGLVKQDGSYDKYQRQMLRWRAIGDALRLIAPDLVMGLLSPEEAESIEPFIAEEPKKLEEMLMPKPKVPQIAPILNEQPKTDIIPPPAPRNTKPEETGKQDGNKTEPDKKHIVTKKEVGDMILELEDGNIENAKAKLKALTIFQGRDGKMVEGKDSLKDVGEVQLKVVYGKVKKLLAEKESQQESWDVPEELKYNEPQDDEPQTLNIDHPDLKGGDIPIPSETVDGLMELVGTLNETQYGLVRGKLLVDNSFKLNKEMTLQEMFAELLPDDADDIRVYIEKTLLKR